MRPALSAICGPHILLGKNLILMYFEIGLHTDIVEEFGKCAD